MTLRTILVLFVTLALSGICHGEERWSNFAEDAEQKYYLDQKSVTSLPDNVYLFWVKSTAKEKDFYKKEFNINNLSYILTNYEIDCALSKYRIRGTIMFDKNRRELNKSLPDAGEPALEPILPESMLELAQDEICSRQAIKQPETTEERPIATPRTPAPSADQNLTAEPPSIQ